MSWVVANNDAALTYERWSLAYGQCRIYAERSASLSPTVNTHFVQRCEKTLCGEQKTSYPAHVGCWCEGCTLLDCPQPFVPLPPYSDSWDRVVELRQFVREICTVDLCENALDVPPQCMRAPCSLPPCKHGWSYSKARISRLQ